MKSLQMPDGVTIQFPADTTEETMNSVASDYWSQKGATVNTPVQFPTSTMEVIQKMQPEVKGRSQAALMGLGQGVTANFADELLGAAGGDQAAYRQKLNEAQKNYPISFGAGQIGGAGVGSAAVLTAIPAIPAAIAASPTLLSRAALSAAASAPGGFVQGLGAAEGDFKQRLPSGITNSLLSAAIGGAMSPIGTSPVKLGANPDAIPLTLGQQSQDMIQQGFESSALKGSKGEPAQKIMSAAREIQNQALTNRLEKLKSGTGVNLNEYTAVNNAVSDINAVRADMNKQVRNAYELARNSGKAEVAALDVKSLLQSNLNEVKQDFNLSTLPKGQSLVNEIENLTSRDATKKSSLLDASGNPIQPLKQLSPVDINDLEKWRRKVSRATQSADPEERAFASAILKKYDDFHTSVLDNALVQGDEATVKAYKNARDLRADFGKRFESNEIVKDILTSDYTPETVVGKIYGAGTFKGKSEASNTVNALIKAAGEQAPQVKNQLKFALVDRLMSRSASNEVDDLGNIIISPAKMRTNINELLNNNRSLANSLLTPEDIALLKDTGQALDKIVSVKPGAINTSNSGEKILANMGRLAGIPIAGDIARSFSNAKSARQAMRALSAMHYQVYKPTAAQAKFVLSGTRAITPNTGLNKGKE